MLNFAKLLNFKQFSSGSALAPLFFFVSFFIDKQLKKRAQR